jgi:hypothetical protein
VKSLKMIAAIAFAISALAACGGSTAATAPPVDASTPAGGSPAPTSAAVPTASPGTAATPGVPAGSVDLCGLLSPADLKTVTGDVYGAGVLDQYGLCTYRVGSAKVNDGKGQLIVAIQAVTMDYVKNAFGSGGTAATVSGHAAFWNPTQGLQTMWVDISGGNCLTLSFDPIVDNSQTFAQRLAEIAVSKM